jgi:hypothetical protein
LESWNLVLSFELTSVHGRGKEREGEGRRGKERRKKRKEGDLSSLTRQGIH